MKIPPSSSVLDDIQFGHMFHMRDPYHQFRDVTRSRTTTRHVPATGTSDYQHSRRARPREVIIPIQVEGRDFPSSSNVIDLTSDTVNTNNSGLSGRSSQRRGLSNGHQHARWTRETEETSSGSANRSTTDWQISRDLLLGAGSHSLRDSEDQLSDEFIDMCMYEDLCTSPDVYVSESLSDRFDNKSEKLSRARCNSKSDTHIAEQGKKRKCHSGPEVTPTPSYPVYRHLKRQLHKDSRQIDYIRGDGNCFFRALSKEIYGSEEFHNDVRQAVVDLMEKYPKEFEQFMDCGIAVADHIKDMRKSSTWASSAEIYAAATLLQRDIYVLSPDHSGNNYSWMLFKILFTYTRDTSYHPCFITLCHTHGNHYDRITPDIGGCNCDQDPPSLSGVHAYVDLTEQDSEVV